MIIGKYIRKLLEEGKRVIFPGFGNLVLAEKGEGVPPSGGHIAPPGKTVRFDAGYSKDDGLLAGTLAEGEKIGLEEARQRVLELVDAIRFSLDKGEPYTLPETGSFTRDEDGRIRFRTDPRWVLDPDQYGLESMDLLELEEESSREDVLPGYEAGSTATEKSPAGMANQDSDVPGRTGPLQREPDRSTTSKGSPLTVPAAPEKKKRGASPWRVIWIIATSLIVILVALIIIPEDYFRGWLENREVVEPGRIYEQGGLENGRDTGEPAAETNQGPDPEGSGSGTVRRDGSAAEETGPATETGEETVAGREVTEQEANYYIVAGSFGNLANASELQDRLRARGFPSEVMVTSNRLYRVTVASYASKENALAGLERIKSTPGLESAWLLAK